MEQPSYYAILTADVRYDNRLTADEKILFSEITALTNKNGYCHATNGYFAKLYEVSNVTISRRISNLKKYGYLKDHMIYKEDSKEIKERRLYVLSNITIPINTNDNTPINNSDNTPINRNDKDNNININNINNNITTTTADSKLSELIEFYQNENFGMITPFKQQTLLHWVDELNSEEQGYDLVLAALKMAVKAEALNLNYAESILRAWSNAGISNIEQARAHERKRSNKTTGNKKKAAEVPKIENKAGKRSADDPEATYADIYSENELKEMAEIGGKTVEEIRNLKVYQ